MTRSLSQGTNRRVNRKIYISPQNERADTVSIWNHVVQYNDSSRIHHVQYNVGGMLFSFSVLENGTLRGNRNPPGREKPLFSDKDDDRRSVS